ncbi:MAG: hypothetical protein LBC83_07325 [Oscillospiraceae bacterium]|jgi:hypothetical protein|nr:hypothetical protein [Oscillospiraceae bacterium]
MMRTLKNQNQRDGERRRLPKTAQDVLPIHAAHEDGIFVVGRGQYAKTWRFTDINYAVAGLEDQQNLFFKYSDLLNACDIGAVTNGRGASLQRGAKRAAGGIAQAEV